MSDALPVEITQHYPLPLKQLPVGWERVWLADIASNVSPGFASGKHSSDGKGVPHLRPMNVDREGQIDLAVVKSVASSEGVELVAGDVLFNNTNSPELVGKTALVSEREAGFAYSNHMTRLRLEPGVEPAFVARQLHFLWMSGYLKTRCTNHVNQASISSATLASAVPLLLAPTAEQHRIVETLESLLGDLDDGVKELQAAQKKLARYQQALLMEAVDGRLTAEWRLRRSQSDEKRETAAQLLERVLRGRRSRWEAQQQAKFEERGKAPPGGWQNKYPQPLEPALSEPATRPASWAVATVDQIARVGTGVTPLRSKSEYFHNGTIPWITSGAVNSEAIDHAAEHVTPLALEECRLEVFPAGTILIAMYGEGKTRGKTSELTIPATINQALAAVVLEEEATPCKSFVKLFLQATYERLREQASGGVQPNLNLQIVKGISVPLPPLDEQAEIVRILTEQLDLIRAQVAATEAGLLRAKAQRQNILRAAFSGALTLQERDDEPAAVLLHRIRNQRTHHWTKPPASRKKSAKEAALMVSKLIDVLREAADWMPAQEAFRRCGIADGAETDHVEALYAELRALDKSNRLAVEAVTDTQGRKLYDRLRLLPAD
jgi:type I restriction enzyme, S subunit